MKKVNCFLHLQVTFLMMPLEIAWAATVMWLAGDALCRILSFFRIFGLFLSSNILICISIDRLDTLPTYLHVPRWFIWYH